ncbi:hypothetical protein ACFFJI_02395 [Allobacillus sp. GCM10007491]|uniref:Uncharacterized protein n=1 Tax=Allobacillus saliphilus TaxID=2912308 RepID=A0A941CWP6_9BACI|nr:hypothetical protein [Allobacillus saliphilus]MBR7554011.1 hypothetical protein [Allobacillus saliphilus]
MKKVLTDTTWLVLQSSAVLAAFIGILLAGRGNDNWVFFVVLTSILTFSAITRATKLTESAD